MVSRATRRRKMLAVLAMLEVASLAAIGVAVSHAASAEPAARATAQLEQCANGAAPSPHTDGCSVEALHWRSVDVGRSDAMYLEGDSIPYRTRIADVAAGSTHRVTIEWTNTVDSSHAIDYLTTFDRTVIGANPCAGVDGCDASNPSLFAVPTDPPLASDDTIATTGNLAMFGGTITAASLTSVTVPTALTTTTTVAPPTAPAPSTTSAVAPTSTEPPGAAAAAAADTMSRLTVSFEATGPNPVLAWGAHVATRADWGGAATAMNLAGSPYRMALVDIDGVPSVQQLTVAADAVVFPASITITADATPPGATPFTFTASPSPLSDVTLLDDGTSSATTTFGELIEFTTYTIAQNAAPGWTLGPINCTVSDPNGGTQRVTVSTVTIDLREGEHVVCTFSNRQQVAHLRLVAEVANSHGGTASAGAFELNATGPTPISGTSTAEGDVRPGTYALAAVGVAGYDVAAWSCTAGTLRGRELTLAEGDNATCTIRPVERRAHLTLTKTVRNTNGGSAEATAFLLIASGPTPATGAGAVDLDVDAGTYSLFSTTVPGYLDEPWSCVGGTLVGSQLVLELGESASCTSVSHDAAVQPAG